MKRNYTGNQRGEVVTGVMVVVMVVMMLFGMSMMHGGHRHADHADHQEMKAADKHNHNTEDSSAQDGEAKHQMRCM